MEYKAGDLVVHAKGTIFPFKNLQGVVVRTDIFAEGSDVYRVFWYTTGRYQHIQESCLTSLDNSLT